MGATLNCIDCWAGFEQLPGNGRPRIRCLRCSPPQRSQPKTKRCVDCGTEFTTNLSHKRRCGSAECSRAVSQRRWKEMRAPMTAKVCDECEATFMTRFPQNQRLCGARACKVAAALRQRQHTLVLCQECWRERKMYVRPTSSQGGAIGKFCSRDCYFARKARLSAEKDALRRIGDNVRAPDRERARERAREQAREQAQARRTRRSLARQRVCVCETCGADFRPSKHACWQRFCSIRCRKAAPSNLETHRRCAAKRRRHENETLARAYVIKVITKRSPIPHHLIPQKLIDAKRAQLKLQRLIKEKQK